MKKQKGMTFVEVMVALLILSIAVLGGISFFISAFKVNYNYMDFANRLDHALRYVEKIKIQRQAYPTYGSFPNMGTEGFTIFYVDSESEDVYAPEPYWYENYTTEDKIWTDFKMPEFPFPDHNDYIVDNRTWSSMTSYRLDNTSATSYFYKYIDYAISSRASYYLKKTTKKSDYLPIGYYYFSSPMSSYLDMHYYVSYDEDNKTGRAFLDFDYAKYTNYFKLTLSTFSTMSTLSYMHGSAFYHMYTFTGAGDYSYKGSSYYTTKWWPSLTPYLTISAGTPPTLPPDDGTNANLGDIEENWEIVDERRYYTKYPSLAEDFVNDCVATVPGKIVNTSTYTTQLTGPIETFSYIAILETERSMGALRVSSIYTWRAYAPSTRKRSIHGPTILGLSSLNNIRHARYRQSDYISVYPVIGELKLPDGGTINVENGQQAKSIIDGIVNNHAEHKDRLKAIIKFAKDNNLKVIKIPFINIYTNNTYSLLNENNL